MVTILASLVGFISSIVPEIIKLFKDHKEKKHQLEIIDRQLKDDSAVGFSVLHQIESAKQMSEQVSLYSTYKSGINWVDALNASVRPVLAYFFFAIYAVVKFAQYKAAMSAPSIMEQIEMIWSADDQAIFAGIISFYYGQRTFSKIWQQR